MKIIESWRSIFCITVQEMMSSYSGQVLNTHGLCFMNVYKRKGNRILKNRKMTFLFKDKEWQTVERNFA